MRDVNLDELVEDFKKLYAADLHSIMRITWPEERVVVVLSEEGITNLSKAFAVAQKWHKQGVATPLFLTKSYVLSSLDTFPLEFLTFQKNFKIEYGEDWLSNLSFDKGSMRLQCEREIKGKVLLMRTKYLETKGGKKEMLRLVSISLPALIRIFYGLLYIRGLETPFVEDVIISKVSEAFKLDKEIFLSLMRSREQKEKPGEDFYSLVERYINEMNRLSTMVEDLVA